MRVEWVEVEQWGLVERCHNIFILLRAHNVDESFLLLFLFHARLRRCDTLFHAAVLGCTVGTKIDMVFLFSLIYLDS